MSDTDTQSDIAANSETSFIVAVPYQGSNGPVAGSYAQLLRMGAWDTTIETGLVTSDGKAFYTSAGGNSIYQGDDPLQDKGILVYSADEYTVYSPQIRTVGETSSSSWSNQNMTVTTDGDKVVAYSYSGPLGITASYQNQDAISMTFGYNCSFVLGSAMTVWTINDASTGLGGLLWSNFGLTQNIFDGQVVNINGSDITVQGIGATSLTESSSIVATSNITLTVNPLTTAATVALKVAGILGQVARFAGDGVVGLGAAAVNVATTVSTEELSEGESSISTAVKDSYDAALAVSAAIVAIQAIASLAGITMSAAAKGLQTATTSGALSLGVAQSSLTQGAGARVGLMPGFVSVDATSVAITGPTIVSIDSGLSKVQVMPAGIFLECGASKIEITAAGIQATGLTAGFNP
jgi:hypothetical protein